MSAEVVVVFFGLRFEIPEDELESLEENTHPLMKRARRVKLDCYGGNFGLPGEWHLLFVGRRLALIGGENTDEYAIEPDVLDRVIAETKERLSRAGFSEPPRLWVQRMPDD